ncbi:MAG: DUF1292 domain-containing protein [Syntrophomonadaceae bacterium]|nr:DUF1292 domain-containing protein [Syntrophomonadaceae bacterium]
MARDGFRDDLENDGEEFEVLILIDDEGQEHSFELIAELEMENSNYVVVAPIDEEMEDEEDEEVEIVILRAIYDEEGNMYLADIEDDEEWEKVADAWQELAESEEIE